MSSPRHGDPAPDVSLETPFGVEVVLRELLQEGPVVLEFIRGTWDPDCRKRLEELGSLARRLGERYGARAIAVSCERAATARARLEERGEDLPLVIDAARAVSRTYGVFRRFSYGAFNVARPATFVVDRCGFVRYAWLSRAPIHRAPLDEIAGVIEELEAEGRRG